MTPPALDADDLDDPDDPDDSADAEPIRFRLRDPVDFVALVPYLLGFHPAQSLVAVLMRDGRLVVTARLDLRPELPATDLADEIARLMIRTEATGCLLLGYGEDDAGRPIVQQVSEHLGIAIIDALWVRDGRWWSLVCTQTDCCPPEGTQFDASSHPLAAEAVVAGLRAGRDRASIAALAAGPSAADCDQLTARMSAIRSRSGRGPRRSRQRRMDRLVRSLTSRRATPTVTQALQLAELSLDVVVRDVALARMTRANADRHLSLWSGVVRQVPDQVASAPLCLLAIAGWLSGNGALLNCCMERMEVIDPQYSLGQICRDISDRALPPSMWDELAGDLQSDLDLVD